MTKINIRTEEEFEVTEEEISEEKEVELEVKSGDNFKPREICMDEKDKTLEKIYEDEGLRLIQRPPRMSKKRIIVGTIIAFIGGLVLGGLLAVYFLRGF